MAKYEQIETTELSPANTVLHQPQLPEIVHLNDPAIFTMVDFTQVRPVVVPAALPMNDALHEMKIQGVHFLLVKSPENNIIGLIASEDILGAKPIQLIQQRRIERELITVKMLMNPIQKIMAFKLKSIQLAKVGNVVVSMHQHNQHYALVINDEINNATNHLCGMFSTWQISRQLHTDIADSIEKAQSISELQHRKK